MSVKLLTSGNGTPLMAYGEKFFASTTGAPETVGIAPYKPKK